MLKCICRHTRCVELPALERSAKHLSHFSTCACHPCAGAMLIFSVSFQFCRMIPERNPMYMSEYLLACKWMAHTAQGRSEGSKKNLYHCSTCACHPCAGAMLIFSVSFQF